MDIKNLLDSFKKYLKMHGKKSSTIESYSRDLKKFLNFLDSQKIALEAVELDVISQYQLNLQEISKENSIRRGIIAIREFFKHIQEEHPHICPHILETIIPERQDTAPRILRTEEITSLIESSEKIHPKLKGVRDAALIAFFSYEGIKVTELLSLRWSDTLISKTFTSIRIKGVKSRVIQISSQTNRLFKAYQKELVAFDTHLIKKNKNIFIAFRGKDYLAPVSHITRHGLKFILYELGDKVGIQKLNTEMLRHFAMEYQLNLGRSTDEIMKQMGLMRVGNIAKHVNKRNHIASVYDTSP